MARKLFGKSRRECLEIGLRTFYGCSKITTITDCDKCDLGKKLYGDGTGNDTSICTALNDIEWTLQKIEDSRDEEEEAY